MEQIRIDPNDFTLGEMEEFEDLTGIPVTSLQTMHDKLPMKAITALAYLARRRDDPDFTIEDARAIKLSDLPEPEPDPTPSTASAEQGSG